MEVDQTMSQMRPRNPCRPGTSYLEVQVAMVLLSIGMAGLYSMSVVQTKQTAQLLRVLPADQTPALNRTQNKWAQKLGVYASLDAATVPVEDLLPYQYVERVIDDTHGDAHYKKDADDPNGWTEWDYSPAYLGHARYHYSLGLPGSHARFEIKDLPEGEYEVLTTYPALASLGQAIPHEIYDDNTLKATVLVNQRVAPSDVSYDGRQWKRLAVIHVQNGKIKVRMQDGSGSTNYIVADAVLVRSARSLDLVSVSKTAGGGATAVLEMP